MELFLNAVWLAIVIAAAVAFIRWSGRQTAARRRIGALATICVLALLFPIISATDDMNAAVAAFEETSAVRRAVLGAMHTIYALPAAVVALATGVVACAARLLLAAAQIVVGASAAQALAGFARIAPFRGPPSSQR